MEWVAEKTGTGVLKAPVFTQGSNVHTYTYIVKFYNKKKYAQFLRAGEWQDTVV